jgi:hypothetical protein
VGVVIQGDEIRATQNFSHVRTYLKDPMPERVASGSPVSLAVGGMPPDPEMFDLQVKRTQKSAFEPMPVSGARLAAQPGAYGLRLFFPLGKGKFDIFEGPQVTIQ